MRQAFCLATLLSYTWFAPSLADSTSSSGHVCPEQSADATEEDISSLLQSAASVIKDKDRGKGESSRAGHLATRESFIAAQNSQAQFHALQDRSKHETRGEPVEVSMARIANDVYFESESGGSGQVDLSQYGWVRVNHYAQSSTTGLEADHVGVYKNKDAGNPICVLAFAGSDSMLDFQSNLALSSQSYCNADNRFQTGFVNELENFRRERLYSDPSYYMTHAWGMIEKSISECSNQLWVVGHSLGGALAEIFSYCVNHDPTYFRNFTIPEVHRIYTFGAPGVSINQLTNAKNGGGCFGGTRFFVMDDYYGDPVPGQLYTASYILSKYQAARLEESTSYSWYGKKSTSYKAHRDDCASSNAKNKPNNWHYPWGAYHSLSEYIKRIGKSYR
jgi:hypothetical protein